MGPRWGATPTTGIRRTLTTLNGRAVSARIWARHLVSLTMSEQRTVCITIPIITTGRRRTVRHRLDLTCRDRTLKIRTVPDPSRRWEPPYTPG
ncbi:hypothetical protein AVEN_29645-1 [Araneus ventricosus]|uniref:Uncharacterized protein n=1 Tax=Araneus ventricosus TaxID=182803 RepID=A0A4Y2NH84_ARAVE|nr:hypothetical protein AVEN_29645-1 [Araneus ventricosus]